MNYCYTIKKKIFETCSKMQFYLKINMQLNVKTSKYVK